MLIYIILGILATGVTALALILIALLVQSEIGYRKMKARFDEQEARVEESLRQARVKLDID